MSLNFPDNPTEGQVFDSAAGTYVFKSTRWTVKEAPPTDISGKVSKTGDNMTGHLALPVGPGGGQAVRKDYVDDAIAAIPNPDMSAKVSKAGDTMTGPLVLADNPTNALEAVPKQYVDAKPSGATIADYPPTSPAPVNGQLWWSSNNGNLYIRYGTAWVQINTVGM